MGCTEREGKSKAGPALQQCMCQIPASWDRKHLQEAGAGRLWGFSALWSPCGLEGCTCLLWRISFWRDVTAHRDVETGKEPGFHVHTPDLLS